MCECELSLSPPPPSVFFDVKMLSYNRRKRQSARTITTALSVIYCFYCAISSKYKRTCAQEVKTPMAYLLQLFSALSSVQVETELQDEDRQTHCTTITTIKCAPITRYIHSTRNGNTVIISSSYILTSCIVWWCNYQLSSALVAAAVAVSTVAGSRL